MFTLHVLILYFLFIIFCYLLFTVLCFNFIFYFYYIFVIYYLLFSIYFFISDGCASESYVGRHFSFSKFPSNSCTAVTGVSWIFKNATGKHSVQMMYTKIPAEAFPLKEFSSFLFLISEIGTANLFIGVWTVFELFFWIVLRRSLIAF
jgi:hypothetical protein